MDKPIIVYTLNKEPKLVPSYQNWVDLYRCSLTLPNAEFNFYNDSKPTDAVINHVRVPIIKFTECYQRKMGIEPERYDTYIAIDPDLMEIISNGHQQECFELQSKIKFLRETYGNSHDRYRGFKSLPWYKRIWKAITNAI